MSHKKRAKRKVFDWNIPPEIEQRLGEYSYGSQRAIYEQGHLLLVLHEPPLVATNERVSRVFWRRGDGHWFCNGTEDGTHHLHELLDSYQVLYEELLVKYSQSQNAQDFFTLAERIRPLSRAATNMYLALKSARDYVAHDTFVISMRDKTYELSRGFEILLDDAEHAIQYRLALNAEFDAHNTRKIHHAQHKLNILAALTLPTMSIATIFGMNVSSGLQPDNYTSFWVLVICGWSLGLITLSWVLWHRE